VSSAQIALAYVLTQPMDIYAVVSCSSPAHFEENRNALHIDLSEAERRWLNLESEELDG
jgi:aryl-alcohol dehydrogenase-like predicted oxidoreductase